MKKIFLTLAIMVSSAIGMNAQGLVLSVGGYNGGATLVVNRDGVYLNGGVSAGYPIRRGYPDRVRVVRPGYSVGSVATVVVPSCRGRVIAGRGYDRYAMARERCINRDRYSRYDNGYSRYSDRNNVYRYDNDDDRSYNDDNDYDDNNYSRYENRNNYDDRVDFGR